MLCVQPAPRDIAARPFSLSPLVFRILMALFARYGRSGETADPASVKSVGHPVSEVVVCCWSRTTGATVAGLGTNRLCLRWLVTAGWLLAGMWLGAPSRLAVAEESPSSRAGAVPSYNRDVRPILATHCFACHGPDAAAREADLRLDHREDALASGAIVPDDPEASELIARILLPDDDPAAMPPASAHRRLTDQEKASLVEWVRAGAEYQSHWSFLAPTRPEMPDVTDPSWVRNPIDRYVLRELDRVGLEPAPQADRRTLARRVALDLIGLPPTVAEVEAFVGDPSPDAYERYVDRLLDSKRYGEHRARYWLDYARYADTHGIHFDNFREIWSYRDWVIDAFNRNLPFDQFTIEQLAGDLLPQPTLDQRVATGFNRCNITTNEGGVIAEEYKVLYARDRTETTSLVWLAMTTGCAACHDHKFDPVSQREFYALSAFFNNTTQPVMDGNVPNTPPVIPVPRAEDRERFASLPAEIAAAQQRVDEVRTAERARFDEIVSTWSADERLDAIPSEGLALHVPLGEGAGPAAALRIDGQPRLRIAPAPLRWAPGHVAPAALELADDSVLTVGDVAGDWDRDSSFSYGAWIFLTQDNVGGAVFAKMDESAAHRGFDLWLEGNKIGAHLIHAWPDDAIKVVSRDPLPANRWHHVFITYDGSGGEAGLQIFLNGQPQTNRIAHAARLEGTLVSDVPLRIGARSEGSIPTGTRVQDVRLYDRQLSPEEIVTLATNTRTAYLLALPAASRSPEQTEELFAGWLPSGSPDYTAAQATLVTLQAEEAAIRAAGTIAHVMSERGEPAEAFVLNRGEYDQRGERVTPDVPAVFPPLPDDAPRDRLALARWLLAPDHPLTARVTVNRFWQEVFGRGLVDTSDDFGITGELPTHPELLDWLAVDFRESGWDIKRLLRLMVTSATYRQLAKTDAEKSSIDPENRLLSRGPRFRLDAETIRDQTLHVSGLLSSKVGGPSVKPYQPEGVWEAVAMRGSNTRDYRQDSGESLYRRSLYTFWKRSAPPAMLDIFNAPSREVCTIRRDRTNTPLQALATLNDPQAVEAARHFAAAVLRGQSDPVARLDQMARGVLARPLDPEEQEIVSESLDALIRHYADDPEAAAALVAVGESPVPTDLAITELAAYTMLANQFLNLDEVLTK